MAQMLQPWVWWHAWQLCAGAVQHVPMLLLPLAYCYWCCCTLAGCPVWAVTALDLGTHLAPFDKCDLRCAERRCGCLSAYFSPQAMALYVVACWQVSLNSCCCRLLPVMAIHKAPCDSCSALGQMPGQLSCWSCSCIFAAPCCRQACCPCQGSKLDPGPAAARPLLLLYCCTLPDDLLHPECMPLPL
jgi:hypothetical protein